MIKIILLIIFCVLSIVMYFLCRHTSDNIKIVSAVISVILLAAAMVDVFMIRSDKDVQQQQKQQQPAKETSDESKIKEEKSNSNPENTMNDKDSKNSESPNNKNDKTSSDKDKGSDTMNNVTR